MDIEGKRRSDNFEDRGDGGGGGNRTGGAAPQLLGAVVRRFGIKGGIVAGVLVVGAYLWAPDAVRSALVGGTESAPASSGAAKACAISPKSQTACDFSRVVLASTEEVWSAKFSAHALPQYLGKTNPAAYRQPTLVVFSNAVTTSGCGGATSALGPFYCSGDNNLYIDPTFYDTMADRLRAPGDFAQAYVIAHEVGHHVQHVIGSLRLAVPGETRTQSSVRSELQADCFAGVWGHSARNNLKIDDKDVAEATQAAHAIGDDTLGHKDTSTFTHGSSKQRIRWFRRGFDSGDPRQCDTFAVRSYADL